MDNVRSLKTEADYDWAIAEVDAYFVNPPQPGTPDGNRFDLLCDLIDAYDARHYPLPDADPIAVIEAHMAEHGLKKKDLGDVIGQKSKATEILKKKRPLSLAMIQNISSKWGISAEYLIKPYHLASRDEDGAEERPSA